VASRKLDDDVLDVLVERKLDAACKGPNVQDPALAPRQVARARKTLCAAPSDSGLTIDESGGFDERAEAVDEVLVVQIHDQGLTEERSQHEIVPRVRDQEPWKDGKTAGEQFGGLPPGERPTHRAG